jgi:hypothetical protein
VRSALAGESGSHREAARLFGAAHSIRQRMDAVRFKVWDVGCEVSVVAVRNTLGENDFDSAWAEGAATSCDWSAKVSATRTSPHGRVCVGDGGAQPDDGHAQAAGEKGCGGQSFQPDPVRQRHCTPHQWYTARINHMPVSEAFRASVEFRCDRGVVIVGVLAIPQYWSTP